VSDAQLTASSIYPSSWDAGCHERHGRLYQRDGLAWCAKYKSASEWLQVDLGVPAKVENTVFNLHRPFDVAQLDGVVISHVGPYSSHSTTPTPTSSRRRPREDRRESVGVSFRLSHAGITSIARVGRVGEDPREEVGVVECELVNWIDDSRRENRTRSILTIPFDLAVPAKAELVQDFQFTPPDVMPWFHVQFFACHALQSIFVQ